MARRARAKCPSLVLHASTQMAIHNAAGAKMAEDAGFARVVLARELSLREIEAIRRQTRLELEVFVHGALCMSASGMCYLSSALGERSGNRGLCAQPCRLNFRENGREYALSLKDLSNLRHLRALTEAGVDSFKIEGRMRRARIRGQRRGRLPQGPARRTLRRGKRSNACSRARDSPMGI